MNSQAKHQELNLMSSEDINQNETCPICLEQNKSMDGNGCSHRSCVDCLIRLTSSKDKSEPIVCPLCRYDLTYWLKDHTTYDTRVSQWETCEVCECCDASVRFYETSNQIWCEDCAQQIMCEECGCWNFEEDLFDGLCRDCRDSVPADDWELTTIFADIIPPQLEQHFIAQKTENGWKAEALNPLRIEYARYRDAVAHQATRIEDYEWNVFKCFMDAREQWEKENTQVEDLMDWCEVKLLPCVYDCVRDQVFVNRIIRQQEDDTGSDQGDVDDLTDRFIDGAFNDWENGMDVAGAFDYENTHNITADIQAEMLSEIIDGYEELTGDKMLPPTLITQGITTLNILRHFAYYHFKENKHLVKHLLWMNPKVIRHCP